MKMRELDEFTQKQICKEFILPKDGNIDVHIVLSILATRLDCIAAIKPPDESMYEMWNLRRNIEIAFQNWKDTISATDV